MHGIHLNPLNIPGYRPEIHVHFFSMLLWLIFLSYYSLYIGHHYPTPKQIRNILKPDASGLAARWHDLGTELLTDDTVGVLDVIEVDYPNDANTCCRKMFRKWLKLQPDASWSQLIIALGNIGMKAAADKVINYLIKGIKYVPVYIYCYCPCKMLAFCTYKLFLK